MASTPTPAPSKMKCPTITFPKLSLLSKVELSSSAAQAIIIIALQSAIAGVFASTVPSSTEGSENAGNYKSITVYLVLFILSQVFQFALVVNALWEGNTIQIFVHVIFNACLFAYSILQITQLKGALSGIVNGAEAYTKIFPLLVTSCVVLAVFTLLFAWLSFKLYLEFGWEIFKRIGASPVMHQMYKAYLVFLMLLKLDFYFFEVFAIQFLVLVLQTADPEYGLTIAIIILALPIVVYAMYCIKLENYWMVAVWYLILLLMIAYFIFKIARMYDPTQAYKYVGSYRFLTVFGTLALTVTVLTMIATSVCVHNFGKGLKDHLNAPAPASNGGIELTSASGPGGPTATTAPAIDLQ